MSGGVERGEGGGWGMGDGMCGEFELMVVGAKDEIV